MRDLFAAFSCGFVRNIFECTLDASAQYLASAPSELQARVQLQAKDDEEARFSNSGLRREKVEREERRRERE